MDDLLKDAIADAKAVRETALANAKIALEEAFTPRIQSMLSNKIQSEMEGEEEEAPVEGKSYRDGEELESDAVQEGTYEDFFQSALKKWGVSAPDELDDEAKVKFFNYVDKNWSGENESD